MSLLNIAQNGEAADFTANMGFLGLCHHHNCARAGHLSEPMKVPPNRKTLNTWIRIASCNLGVGGRGV
jgi:hypothetical protein